MSSSGNMLEQRESHQYDLHCFPSPPLAPPKQNSANLWYLGKCTVYSLTHWPSCDAYFGSNDPIPMLTLSNKPSEFFFVFFVFCMNEMVFFHSSVYISSYASCSDLNVNIGKVYGNEKFSSVGCSSQAREMARLPSGWKSTQNIDLFVLEKQADLCPSVYYFWCFSNLPKKFSKLKCFSAIFQ